MAGDGQNANMIGGHEDLVRGVLVQGADAGNRTAEVVAREIVEAANALVQAGHTVLHFAGVEAPRPGMVGSSGPTRADILVLGQRNSQYYEYPGSPRVGSGRVTV